MVARTSLPASRVLLPTRRLLWRVLVVLSVLVVALLAASFLSSRGLPTSEEDRSGCYWTSALVVYVQCNAANVPAAGVRALFYHAWLIGLFYSPAFTLGLPYSILHGEASPKALLWMPLVALPGLVSWGAIAVLIWAAGRAIFRRR
jgi:hypothetical protein